MAMINKLKEFLEKREESVYSLRQKTGIANATAYHLVNDSSAIPNGAVLSKICQAYRVQPCAFLEWIDDDHKPSDA